MLKRVSKNAPSADGACSTLARHAYCRPPFQWKILIPKCRVDMKEIKIPRPTECCGNKTPTNQFVISCFFSWLFTSKDLRIVPSSRITLSKSNQRHHSADLNAAYNFFVLCFLWMPRSEWTQSLIFFNIHFIACSQIQGMWGYVKWMWKSVW